jgi:hypothetical protein
MEGRGDALAAAIADIRSDIRVIRQILDPPPVPRPR